MPRIIRFHELGGPEVLRTEEIDIPAPGPGSVRVRVKAIGLNRADVMFRRGLYIEEAHLPSRLGYEAAGTIDAVGGGVSEFTVGDEVSLIPQTNLAQNGTYGEVLVAPVRFVAPKPPSLSFAQAAAVWMQYLTAYGGLIAVGGVKAKDFIVITAATSSVGLAAIQIARCVGALPIATTRTQEQKRAILALGAEHVIATDEESLADRLDEITGGEGIQTVFDAVGGMQVMDFARAMAPRGIIVAHGMLSPDPTPFPLKIAISKSLTMRGYVFTEIVTNTSLLTAAKHFILEGLKAGHLRPLISKTFGFDEIVEAHRYLESDQQIGKIVVTL
jgi:NADPH:quinone reductase